MPQRTIYANRVGSKDPGNTGQYIFLDKIDPIRLNLKFFLAFAKFENMICKKYTNFDFNVDSRQLLRSCHDFSGDPNCRLQTLKMDSTLHLAPGKLTLVKGGGSPRNLQMNVTRFRSSKKMRKMAKKSIFLYYWPLALGTSKF